MSAAERERRVLAPFARRQAPVTRNERVGAYRVLWVDDAAGPAPAPGQFAMIAAAQHWGGGQDERPYLARAFSVARRLDDGESAFLLEDVGPGTARLCELQVGEPLSLLGPLGRGFSPLATGEHAVLIGGGVGIAPLAILQDELGPARSTALLGFRDRAHAAGAEFLPGAQVATDDGSLGHHGPVTELLAPLLERRAQGAEGALVVRACGPPAMLEAVRAICEREQLPAELALEAGMACGFGSCYGCVAPRRDGSYLRVCLDGPVVDAAELACVR